MQELIGDLTVDQFTQFIGVLVGCVLFVFTVWLLLTALVHGIFDGWLFRKGALYYCSLRYLNKHFKRFKNCGTVESLEKAYSELIVITSLLRYQRTIPKILYFPLMKKLEFIYNKRKVEISNYWND